MEGMKEGREGRREGGKEEETKEGRSNYTLFGTDYVPGTHSVLDTIIHFILVTDMEHYLHFTAEKMKINLNNYNMRSNN